MTDAEKWSHQPVLLTETLAALAITPGGRYVDGAFGRGGHAGAILGRLGPEGCLLAMDRDPAAEECARTRFSRDRRFIFAGRPFSRLAEVVAELGWTGRVNGILFDLGVSSPQLDDPGRGFSFTRNGPLDMRMDPTTGCSAAEWLAQVTEAELSRVLVQFGEERFHRRIAREIVAARQQAPVVTTRRLAEIVAAAIPTREPGKHPATRVFQAIRIVINDELGEISAVLPQAVQILAPGGRLAVISFHSLEDRLVKQFMREQVHGREWPLDLPVTGAPECRTLRLVGRPLRSGSVEATVNPRARSALLRVAERLA